MLLHRYLKTNILPYICILFLWIYQRCTVVNIDVKELFLSDCIVKISWLGFNCSLRRRCFRGLGLYYFVVFLFGLFIEVSTRYETSICFLLPLFHYNLQEIYKIIKSIKITIFILIQRENKRIFLY